MKRAPDEHDIIGTRPARPEAAGDLPLFAQAGAGSNATVHPRAVPASVLHEDPVFGKPTGPGTREFVKAALLEHVTKLRGPFTADDVQDLAIEHGFGTGHEKDQRTWSWVGPWLAVLARRGKIRALVDQHGYPVRKKSERSEAHGNLQLAYGKAA